MPHEFVRQELDPKPPILVEARSSFDQRERGKLIERFTRLQEDDGTHACIVPALASVRHVCDRMAALYWVDRVEGADGRALFFEPPHLSTKPAAALTPEAKPLHGGNMVLGGERPRPIPVRPGRDFVPRCPRAFARRRIEASVLLGPTPRHIAAWPPFHPPKGPVTPAPRDVA